MNFKHLIKSATKSLDANSPTILSGLGVAGVVTTTILAVQGTIKANQKVLNCREKEFLQADYTNKEILEMVWPYYIPTVISGTLTVIAIIGSNHVSSRRSAALVSLYTIADKSLQEYKDKVVEVVGEKKSTQIQDEIAQDKLNSDPVDRTSIVFTANGEHLFYDVLSGRYFRSDLETVRRIQNDFNEQLFSDMYLTVNDLYYLLDLEDTELGRDVGWDVNNGKLEFQFSAKIASTGEPCIVLQYSVEPKNL